MQLGEDLQTTCLHCGSVFRITTDQLEAARGQARCSQCTQVFNALFTLENYSGQQDSQALAATRQVVSEIQQIDNESSEKPVPKTVTLNEAMFADGADSKHSLKPLLWMLGILLLLIFTVVQVIYYQRYPLVSSTQYQQQILNLCRILPCDESRFSSLEQVQLIERHVFSHPTQENALMITGSFMNRASFVQQLPNLLISLSDIQGKLIANRLFTPQEYLTDQSVSELSPGKAVLFRLEIIDPGTDALTYEFEFIL